MVRKAFLVLCGVLILILAVLPPAAVPSTVGEIEISQRIPETDAPYIKIGMYASLTGAASLLGQMGQEGVHLAVEKINIEGGIHGRPIRLIEYDDQTKSSVAVDAVRRMIEDDHVDAIIGSHTSGNIVNTAALSEKAHVLQIGLGTSYLWTNVGYQYLFRATGNSKSYDQAILQAIRTDGRKRIAVYYSATDYAIAGAKELMDWIRADDTLQLVWSHSNDISQTDFKQDFVSLIASGADAVILYSTSENAGLQLRQLHKAHFVGNIYAPEAFSSTQVRSVAGNSLQNLTYACTYSIPDSPAEAATLEERSFLEAFIKKYGTMPVADTAYRGYDAVMLLAEAFRTAASLNSEDLRNAMLSITNYRGIGGTFNFSDGSGDGLSGCRVYRILNYKPVQVVSSISG